MKTTKYMCGFACWHPDWMQKFANSKAFLIVYGFLGTVQAMSYLYFIITLTTMERRFKIPSSITGIILSGNEISQILLSLILSYTGGQRNRPRWIGVGVIFSAASCFILYLPHLLYGPGEEALRLTKEYNEHSNIEFILLNSTATKNALHKSRNHLCMADEQPEKCDEFFSTVPLVLIFLSQFVLGIGNTLYYSLGQPYLDDNTKKTNTPMMLAYAMALRMIGPVFGFGFGAVALKIYIDPSKTPLIDSQDPRWLGAWWLGWVILGFALLIFAFLISLFPRELRKKSDTLSPPTSASVLLKDGRELTEREALPLKYDDEKFEYFGSLDKDKFTGSVVEIPQLKDFPTALKRLLKNKVLMCNITSTIFYILGASGYMTFIAKYMEVQFNKSSADSITLTGPATLAGMVMGVLASGYIISKKKPSSSKLLLWNVIVGCFFILGQTTYLFLSCSNENIQIQNSKLINLTSSCNARCGCDSVPYTPVCDVSTDTTYFSACHAGCDQYNEAEKVYSECKCSKGYNPLSLASKVDNPKYDYDFEKSDSWWNENSTFSSDSEIENQHEIIENSNLIIPGVCIKGCALGFYLFALTSMIINCLGSSGRITNLLVNYRCVDKKDKSFSQGLFLMFISLFAMIPGPILYGYIIDKSCLIWNYKCEQRGNCQLYDQTLFRYYINFTAMGLTSMAVIFDTLVWYYGRHVDFYVENENTF